MKFVLRWNNAISSGNKVKTVAHSYRDLAELTLSLYYYLWPFVNNFWS